MEVFLKIKRLVSEKHLIIFTETGIFLILTVIIHFFYRYWMVELDYVLFGVQLITPEMESWMTNAVFIFSSFLLSPFLDFSTTKNVFHFVNDYSVLINDSCAGIKQILQFVFLIMIYPGPWKQKLWFIPAGTIIVFITTIIRIVGLCFVMNYWPDHWRFAHDYPFRIFFYIVIFMLWLFWNEKIYHPYLEAKVKSKS